MSTVASPLRKPGRAVVFWWQEDAVGKLAGTDLENKSIVEVPIRAVH